ncbi:hypothetical protein HKD37_07G020029 [Glycine soja]
MFCEVSRPFVVRWKDQLDHHWHLIDRHGNLHDVVYNKDLTSLTIVHRWTKLRTFYRLEGAHYSVSLLANRIQNHQCCKIFSKMTLIIPSSTTFKLLLNEYKATCNNLDVPSSMHYFMKEKRFTQLNIADCAVKCRITTKIGSGWRDFSKSQSFKVDMELVFEFPDSNVNYAFIWPCL